MTCMLIFEMKIGYFGIKLEIYAFVRIKIIRKSNRSICWIEVNSEEINLEARSVHR